MTEPKQPCIEALRLSRPDVAITVTRQRDESYVWYGDDPDPEEADLYAYDVDVTATAVRNGTMIEGTTSLGGSYCTCRQKTSRPKIRPSCWRACAIWQ
jgi:hypothetical protein